ncbi:ABC transporter permease [Clostridium septicum]|uniref:ABC transporter permease n=2 Tax=Clostridium septicum TaxID=1504 RepID=A0A9N7JM94_CLOSE|nr:FtsX-like permease family protein [Clostridium septicum]AYE34614.1 ABC transporter substrate-binding protein [Clostridium septicum]QAS60014.1 ABC transporter permease [Clostridium septicum]UEC20745.1 ABC transporter permease [Clostridium septicum]USS01205.1 ABC transporter permease [Clostridium septicum]
MKFSDLVQIIWKNMWKRRTRTIFTMSGVVIGCLAVFIISSITNGFQKYLTDEMESMMDTSVITLTPYWGAEEGKDKKEGASKKTKLDNKSVEELEKLYFITEVMPKKYTNVSTKLKKTEGFARVLATDFITNKEEDLLFGRYPRKGSKEIVLGYETAKELLGYTWEEKVKDEDEYNSLIGKSVKMGINLGYDEDGKLIDGKKFSAKIVGVLSNGKMEYNYLIQAPIKFVDSIIKSNVNLPKEEIDKMLNTYEEIGVKVDDKSKLEEYEETLKSMGYSTRSLIDFEKQSKSMLLGVTLVLGTLAGISLLVAALGITNTMDMAIYERNKEIGVIKVIGGSLNDVRKIFVGEACAISFTGGSIAIVLGLIVDLIINNVGKSMTQSIMGQPISSIAIPSIGLIIGILTFSLFIGFIAGILPANKAAKTNVITAIR